MKTIKKFTFVTLVALAAMLLFQTSITQAADRDSDDDQRIDIPFAVLLDGVYKPVAKGEGPKDNLGLKLVDLSDGTFSKVKMYSVSGHPGDDDENEATGTFYVRFGGGICAYDLPGGAFTARFTGFDTERKNDPDGSWTLDGTAKLAILEATGVYQQPLAGGHIHMVDILKWRAGEQNFLEYCFCHIHRNLFTP
jgi:hypothetical protein